MIRIELDSSTVIRYCSIKVALLAVGEPPVMVKIGLSWLYLNRCREALNCLVEVTAPVQRDTLIVVSVGVFRVNLNRCCIVLDSRTKLT